MRELNSNELALDQGWKAFPDSIELRTPAQQSSFTVRKIDEQVMQVQTQGDNAFVIPRQSFIAALAFLREHGHRPGNPCPIRAGFDNPGPLNQATQLNGRVTIMYILPVLKHMALVEINPARPSSTWLVQ
jgi:hypothetical protein